ncbi:pyridoxamine 5'-phosphate oxidase family protein [Chryseotalea sanaruensis]|uniref:Pyridoxamine 5'-phosphate oxidase family protein n=1 Tax=Chryseotalea sanaruensis TaxID=2482724 RepID=A0A401U680_9BACT|nr:pyridoxamine 5'-phosphate oxidase family protein [Chryseotalea sanaruensis]GCC50387.1 pyridoxamine 5'-phosphate oxidase family protein [Chryseotalea sanaruensis]
MNPIKFNSMLGTLSGEQIEHVLRNQIIGRIGCYAADEVYVVPVTYVFHEGYIYAHSKEGRKIKMMRKNPNVCFQIDTMENMTNWRSVIVWGVYEELKTESEQVAGMKIMMDRLMPLITSESVRPTQGNAHPPEIIEKGFKAVAYRIKVTKSTGRFEKTSAYDLE